MSVGAAVTAACRPMGPQWGGDHAGKGSPVGGGCRQVETGHIKVSQPMSGWEREESKGDKQR